MKPFNLEQAIAHWRDEMLAAGFKRGEELDELEAHLREEFERQLHSGASEERAFELALDRLGRPIALHQEFTEADASRKFSAGAAMAPIVQQALAAAQEEAKRLGQDFVGTEHVLLGLLRVAGASLAERLRRMHLDGEVVRAETERAIFRVAPTAERGSFPLTPRVCKALKLAAKEAGGPRRTTLTPEHVFMGLLLEKGGVAGRVLRSLGCTAANARTALQNSL